MEAYYALMKGEYIEVGKLEIYHFLRKISTFHMVPNDITGEYPCSEKEVLEVKEILCGEKDMNYTFNLKVFKSMYQNEAYKWREEEFKKLRGIVEKTSLNDIPSSVMNILIDYVNQDSNEIHSLVDLFEEHIKGIIAENIDFEEEILDFRQSVGIYTGGREVNKKAFIPNLKKLLDCVIGDIPFRISIIYKKGKPNVSLVLL